MSTLLPLLLVFSFVGLLGFLCWKVVAACPFCWRFHPEDQPCKERLEDDGDSVIG